MSPMPGQLRVNCTLPRGAARSAVDLALDQAVMTTTRAYTPTFDRVPVPVRYRASGAIQAWTAARRAAGRSGERLTGFLADPSYPPLKLYNHLADFVDRHSTLDFNSGDGRLVAVRGSHSVFAQAFWQRAGEIYEPTSAMHQILDMTDIDESVPLRFVQPSKPAICIVPPASSRAALGGVEAIGIFSHAGDEGGSRGRHLTFVAWSRVDIPQPVDGLEVLHVAVDNEDESIGAVLGRAMRNPALFEHSALPQEECLQRWRATLAYVVKLLLFLALDSTEVLHERPYSTAARVFPGLGRKKREARLAEVDQLYDRFVVGPAALTGELEAARDAHDVAAHWRRPHFKTQPHGPNNSLRKLVVGAD